MKDSAHQIYVYVICGLFLVILLSQIHSVDDINTQFENIHKNIIEVQETMTKDFTLNYTSEEIIELFKVTSEKWKRAFNLSSEDLKIKTDEIIKLLKIAAEDWKFTLNNTSEVLKNHLNIRAQDFMEFVNKTSNKILETQIEINQLIDQKKLEIEASFGISPDSTYTFKEIILSRGYPLEEHIIQTADGHLLKFFRIQSKILKFCIPFKKVVYLQHGLIDSSDTWIANYDEISLPFILADAGFDVWLGNTRGNKHSRSHLWKNPDISPEYWDFTWQDMALYDLPAAFQYIHAVTLDKVNYIGHSQGGTIMIAALAEQVEDVKRYLDRFIALGPVIYLSNPETALFKLIGSIELAGLLKLFQINEFFEANSITNPTTSYICSIIPSICKDLISFVSDDNSELINKERLHVWTGHYPSGTSVKNLIHYQQMLSYKEIELMKFDYGNNDMNELIYGQEKPPVYDLTSIEERIYLYAGLEDKMSPIKYMRIVAGKFQNVVYQEINAGHLSFLLGKDLAYIYEIVEILKNNDG